MFVWLLDDPVPRAPSECGNTANAFERKGFGPIQIWVPDVRAPQFVRQAHVQSLAFATSHHAAADQAFIDAVSADDV